MIKTYADKDTKTLYEIGHSKKYASFERIALRKLDMLNAACNVNALRIPPGNHLEQLSGNREGQYSIVSMNNGVSALLGTGRMPLMLK